MTRQIFLTVAASIGIAVGVFAMFWPAALLASKGVAQAPGTWVWVREVGVLIFAQGVTAGLIRKQPDSATLRAVLATSALVQLGLFPIELIAWRDGVVTQVEGIAPNSVLHVCLAAGFAWYWRRCR